MTDPIYDGFRALVDVTDDEVVKARLTKKVEALFVDKKEEHVYAETYLEIERELIMHGKGHLGGRDIRNRIKRSFAGVEEMHPGFSLLFLSDERQYIKLVNDLIGAYADEWQIFFGNRATSLAVESALGDTPWESIEVDREKGIRFDPVRMRSLNECSEIALALFGTWHESGRIRFGTKANTRSFERAYRKVVGRHSYLPVVPKLLGAMPLDVLADEKAERIRELETKTSTQERSILAADEDLRRQSVRLQETVGELGVTKEKLAQTSKARSEFITVVSHQFRTPLSSIRWNSELLTDAAISGDIDKEFAETIDMMREKSVYLIETLDRVFTTLDIDTNELHLDFKKTFLWEVVQDVYSKYEKEIKRHGLKWKFNRRKEQVQEIPLDKDKISMVLGILISNAMLYNKDGGMIEVDVDTVERNGKTYQVCSIQDEGIGVLKSDLDKVFQKFYRSKSSVLKVADGTGLGMYVVKNIIEGHGGEVLIESGGKEKGTKISFTIPLP